jgi:pilus assembly protein CpaF
MTDLVGRVRRRLAVDPADLDTVVRAEHQGVLDDAAAARLRGAVAAELLGAGPLEPLLALPGVTDVLVNGSDEVWVDRGVGLQRAEASFADDGAVRRLAQRLATAAGRRLDDAVPFVDAALADGTRLHAVLPPITARPTLSLRVLARRRYGLSDLAAAGAMPVAVAEVLRAVITARLGFVVSGGTGTGKTTLLGAMLAHAEPTERLVLIEDAAELTVAHSHVVRLVTRTVNVEQAGAVGLRELVRQSLRMRPDRLVVGEFRGAEMIELLVALNTGHDGGAATLHANSAADVPARLTALAALAGVSESGVTALAASALEVIVALRRRHGVRTVDEIATIDRCGDRLAVTSAWRSDAGIGPAATTLRDRLASRGAAVPGLLR